MAHSAVGRAGGAGDQSTYAVAVLDRATGELAGNPSANRALFSASLVKLAVAIDVLQRRHGGLQVSNSDLRLIERSLRLSDDDAMNVLWERFDGVGAVSRIAAQLRLTDLKPPSDPAWWGETVVSARDVVLLFEHVLTRMPPRDRELIMGALEAAPAIAAEGFDQAFGLESPTLHIPSATKAGWMCCHSGQLSMHSAGVLGNDRRFVAAVLSDQPGGAGYSHARDQVTDVADDLVRELR
ncbi:serine hydrolase [Parasphingorhabdus pacifica]